MACILLQVRGRLPPAATKFLGSVAGPAAVVQTSRGGHPCPPAFLAPDGDTRSPVSLPLPPAPVLPALGSQLFSDKPDRAPLRLLFPSLSQPLLGKRSWPFFWGQRKAGEAGAHRLTDSAVLGCQPAWD